MIKSKRILLFTVLSLCLIQNIICKNLSESEKIMAEQNPWDLVDEKLLAEVKDYQDSAIAFFAWLLQAGVLIGISEYTIHKLTELEVGTAAPVEAILAAIIAVFPTRTLVHRLNEESERRVLKKFLENYTEEYSKFLPRELKSLFDELNGQYKENGDEFINKVAHDVITHIKSIPRINSNISLSINGEVIWPDL